MKARVLVKLKPAVHDPQGETIGNALQGLDYQKVGSVRQGKFFELDLDVGSRDEALALAREIAERVLSNPVLEIFEVEIET